MVLFVTGTPTQSTSSFRVSMLNICGVHSAAVHISAFRFTRIHIILLCKKENKEKRKWQVWWASLLGCGIKMPVEEVMITVCIASGPC